MAQAVTNVMLKPFHKDCSDVATELTCLDDTVFRLYLQNSAVLKLPCTALLLSTVVQSHLLDSA